MPDLWRNMRTSEGGGFTKVQTAHKGGTKVTKTHNLRHALDALSPSIFGTDNFLNTRIPYTRTLRESTAESKRNTFSALSKMFLDTHQLISPCFQEQSSPEQHLSKSSCSYRKEESLSSTGFE